jgi:OmpA-OmpF porin, OOP family
VLTVQPTQRRPGLEKLGVFLILFGLSAVFTRSARAAGCASSTGLTPCFDANSLWLPAGQAAFMTLADTRVNPPQRMSFGFGAELLRGPVSAHVASPDSAGRDVRIVDYALDASLLFAVGVLPNFEASVAIPLRLYQRGAGAGGVSSQSSPEIEQTALRDPRLGVAYSLDSALKKPGLGLRLALDVSLPLGNEAAFAGERSLVAMPSVTFGWQLGRVALRAASGARFRRAVDFADVRLGNQGFLALGVGVDVLAPGLLFLSLEGFALPPLGSSRSDTASPSLSAVSLFPAEWLFAMRSSFRPGGQWSLAASVGTGLPFSSETRSAASGESTSHFLGVTEPEWRTLVILRFAPR